MSPHISSTSAKQTHAVHSAGFNANKRKPRQPVQVQHCFCESCAHHLHVASSRTNLLCNPHALQASCRDAAGLTAGYRLWINFANVHTAKLNAEMLLDRLQDAEFRLFTRCSHCRAQCRDAAGLTAGYTGIELFTQLLTLQSSMQRRCST